MVGVAKVCDVQAIAGSTTMSWSVPTQNVDGTPLTDLSGYRVIYGTSPNNLNQSQSVTGAATTALMLTGLAAGGYYFAAVTVNSAGIASAPSGVAAGAVP